MAHPQVVALPLFDRLAHATSTGGRQNQQQESFGIPFHRYTTLTQLDQTTFARSSERSTLE
jgi:hypothetical protein